VPYRSAGAAPNDHHNTKPQQKQALPRLYYFQRSLMARFFGHTFIAAFPSLGLSGVLPIINRFSFECAIEITMFVCFIASTIEIGGKMERKRHTNHKLD
jgi:hypothetical protein